MTFSWSKSDWIGFGNSKKWGKLKLGKGGEEKDMVEEIRILGYRLDRKLTMREHVDYWVERGVDVKRRIASVGRRYGSRGGIRAWENFRLIQSAYVPTISYGIEFIGNNVSRNEKLNINMRDTIRSTFRAPLKIANNILLAEIGIPPIEIQRRYAERRGYYRQIKYQYGKGLPWYGCIGNKWKDERIKGGKEETEELEKTKKKTVIAKNKEDALKMHGEMWERGKERNELWVYTDGSKTEDGTAMAWIVMEGDELVETVKGMRVPTAWSITKAEIGAMIMAMRSLRGLGASKIRIFSDSKTGIEKIRNANDNSDDVDLRNLLINSVNRWDEVTIVWIPGHSGVVGNETADNTAKWYRKQHLLENGRWREVDYEEDATTINRQIRQEEWMEWHKAEGHDHYKRTPKKPTHLKKLSRMDMYVLLWVRSGGDKRGHESCKNFEFRHHLALCDRYSKMRPELQDIHDDSKLEKWVEWWTKNEFLGMGIPMNTPEQMGTRVMFGNPFDRTITIEKMGEAITEKIEDSLCRKCEKSHHGKCLLEVELPKGRWFFIDDNKLECQECGGKYGGGSTSRPGGSGLKAHLNHQKPKRCGLRWEQKYWKETIKNWSDLGGKEKDGLTMKWMEVMLKERLNCVGCDKKLKKMDELKLHVRREKVCFAKLVEVMLKNPIGLD